MARKICAKTRRSTPKTSGGSLSYPIKYVPRVLQTKFSVTHTIPKTHARLSKSFVDHTSPDIWPPNSLDCTPWLLISLCRVGGRERATNKITCNTKDDLKATVTRAFEDLSRKALTKAGSCFQGHLKATIEAKGGFIE